MSIAALEAGLAYNNSSVTIVHGMSRQIGALFHVPHGLSNAMLLEACFTYVVDGAYDRFAQLAKEINIANDNMSNEETAKAFKKYVDPHEVDDVIKIYNNLWR